MFITRKQSTFISGVLSFALTFVLLEQIQQSPLVPVFHNSSYEVIETKVFNRFVEEREKLTHLKREKAKARITKVMKGYKTGMNDEFVRSTPDLILRESDKYGYDPLFLTALIITESSFNNWAKSSRGALGLMQIRPRTGMVLAQETQMVWNGAPTLYEPDSNIALGAYYLNKMIERFGDLNLALEAYNHGPSQLSRYLRKGYRPKKYSKRVHNHYQRIKSLSI